MPAQSNTRLVQWQDLQVRSDADTVLAIAEESGWTGCEIFGRGDMLTQPLESNGWMLVPADLYEYSIPAAGINRVLQVVSAGVRIQGVIIADDLHHKHPSAHRQRNTLATINSILLFIGKSLLGLILCALLIAAAVFILRHFLAAAVLAPLVLLGMGASYDPKLIILVDDGTGGILWVSILTWYE